MTHLPPDLAARLIRLVHSLVLLTGGSRTSCVFVRQSEEFEEFEEDGEDSEDGDS
jgi:hypothetical protein